MKRLFMLRKRRGGPSIPNVYFDNKAKAKTERDKLGGETVVSYGPDHYKFNESFGGEK